MYDIAIIGARMAGLTAAIYTKRARKFVRGICPLAPLASTQVQINSLGPTASRLGACFNHLT